jgi:hypothetical protein
MLPFNEKSARRPVSGMSKRFFQDTHGQQNVSSTLLFFHKKCPFSQSFHSLCHEKMVSISRIVLNIRCQRVGAPSDSVAKCLGVGSKQVL